jgi:NAD(P)-dependent dehydrogenase (short-subunit alcohol dehydrogenase family)
MKHPFDLTGKTIFITGASSGIGKATAVTCAQLGATLIISGRNEERLTSVLNSLTGDGHKMICFDFETDNLERIITLIPKLDGIVHSAGVVLTLPFAFTNSQHLERIMKINFMIPFTLTQRLVKEKLVNKNASIVFVSSISGVSVVGHGISAYSASKGAISASIRVMALELAAKKIRVNTVCPGMVRTEMNEGNSNVSQEQLTADEKRNYPLGYGQPENVSEPIAFLLSEAAKWISGLNLTLDGGASIQ